MIFWRYTLVNSTCAQSWACGKHVLGLPDLILFWVNDVLVVCVCRCGLTRGTLLGERVLSLIYLNDNDRRFA